MSIQIRKPKLKQMLQSTRLVHRDSQYRRIYRMDSPTSGRPYQVRTVWSVSADKVVTVQCSLFGFDANSRDGHPANDSQYICCQMLASVKRAASDCGKVLSLPQKGDIASARRLLRLGGHLVRIVNGRGSEVWGTVR